MKPKETLRHIEKENVENHYGDFSVSKGVHDGQALFQARTRMLSSIEDYLSPLLKRALEIKLTNERDEFDQILESEVEAEKERTRRRGVLDSQFFRKKRLNLKTW